MNQHYYELWEKAGFPEDEWGIAVIPKLTPPPQSKRGERNGNQQITIQSNRTGTTQTAISRKPNQ